MAEKKGSGGQPASESAKAKLGLRKVQVQQVENRRRHMLDYEVFIPWDRYGAVGTTLGSKLISRVAVKGGHVKQPTLFSLHETDLYPGDYILEPTLERDGSTIEAHWETASKVILHLEPLLAKHPLKTPIHHKAYIKLFEEEGGLIRLQMSEPRYALTTKRSPRKKQGEEPKVEATTESKEGVNPKPANETAASQSKP